jgi:hypothetical protein
LISVKRSSTRTGSTFLGEGEAHQLIPISLFGSTLYDLHGRLDW